MSSRLIDVSTEMPASISSCDVLVALRMRRAGRIVGRQPVDEADSRLPRQHGGHVDHAHAVQDPRRHRLRAAGRSRRSSALSMSGCLRRRRRRPRRVRAGGAFVEQPERFADARRVAEKHLQLAARSAASASTQQCLGIGAKVGHAADGLQTTDSEYGRRTDRLPALTDCLLPTSPTAYYGRTVRRAPGSASARSRAARR